MAVERGSEDVSARFRSVVTHTHTHTHTHSRHAKLKVASALVPSIQLSRMTTDQKLHTGILRYFYKRSRLGVDTIMSLHRVLPHAFKPQSDDIFNSRSILHLQSVSRFAYFGREENQIDATECFIALIICSTCFGHLYAHHQDLETILVLLPHLVCDVLVAGGQRSRAGQQAMCPG